MFSRLRNHGLRTLAACGMVVAGVTASAGATPWRAVPVASTTANVTLTSTVPQSASVGALFTAGSSQHSCSASVVDSPAGDVIVTAAHCVTGTGVGMRFAPGYLDGSAPYGYWTVTGAYTAQGWLTSQDPTDDIAVLKVANRTIDGVSRSVESIVGGATIGSTASTGTTVTVTGYPAGTVGSTTCTTTTSTTKSSGVAYPTFTCGSFPDGTSGGPWLTHNGGTTSIVGLIGGLHQGGCTDATSYSSPIDTTLTKLVQRSSTTSADTLPKPASNGC